MSFSRENPKTHISSLKKYEFFEGELKNSYLAAEKV